MKSINIKVIKWGIIIIAFLGFISSISLIFIYMTANPLITRFNLILGILNVLLIVPFLIFLSTFLLNNESIFARLFQILLVLGATILIKGRIQLITGEEIITIFPDKTLYWEFFGAGLIGIAVLTFILMKPSNPGLKIGHTSIRVFFGVGVFTYIIALIFQKEFKQIVGGYLGITEVNPIVLVILFTILCISVVARSIWLFYVSRIMLKNKEKK